VLIAGLTGGMACGKSFVAQELARLGARVIEADALGHRALAAGGEAYEPVVALFGREILGANGSIDRAALAARVFSDPAALERLNAIVHPAVRKMALAEMENIRAREPRAVVIYVAAILFESGAYRDVQKTIVVHCTRAQQIERAQSRSGLTEAQIVARLDRQMPLDEKIARADYTIDASGTPEDTLRETRQIWENLVRQA